MEQTGCLTALTCLRTRLTSGERSGLETWSDHSNTRAGQSRVPWNWGSADKTKSREGTKSDFPARLRLQYRSSPEQLAVRRGRSLLKSLRGLHPNTVATSFFTSDQARLPKGSISIGIQREKIFFFLNFGTSALANSNRRTKQRFVKRPGAIIYVIITWAETKILKEKMKWTVQF